MRRAAKPQHHYRDGFLPSFAQGDPWAVRWGLKTRFGSKPDGSISDSIGLDGFEAKACGGSQGFSTSMIG